MPEIIVAGFLVMAGLLFLSFTISTAADTIASALRELAHSKR